MTTLKNWSTCLEDWQSKIVNEESLIPCPPLNKQVADIAVKIFKSLILVDFYKKTLGEVCKQWVFDFVAVIFGAYDPIERERYIKEFFLLIAKKNSKSTIASGIMLTAIILNERHSAQFVIVSPTKETSESSFRPVADMIKADPKLLKMFNVADHGKTITHLGTKATLKVLAFDANTLTGLKATGILVDEIHLLGNKPQADTILREAMGGMLSRPEGFCIYLTTQSSGTPNGIFKQKLEYARAVRDGKVINNQFLPVLYEYPEAMLLDESYLDPKNWYIPNPNYDASLKIKDLVRQYEQIKDIRESLQDFLSKHLNVQQTMNLKANNWELFTDLLPRSEIDLSLEELIEQSEVISIGFDGARVYDLAGLTVTGRIKNTTEYLTWSHGWLNRVAIDKNKRSATKLLELEALKEITIVDQEAQQFTEITALIKMIDQSGKLYQIGVDAAGLGNFKTDLEEAGVDINKIIPIRQGIQLQNYITAVEQLLFKGSIKFARQELIRWQASNTRLISKFNAVMISKEDSTDKIDNIISMLNSIAIMVTNPPSMTTKKANIYFF